MRPVCTYQTRAKVDQVGQLYWKCHCLNYSNSQVIAVQCAPPVSHSGHWPSLYTNLLGNQCPPPQAIGDVSVTHQLMLCFAVRGQSLQPEPIATLAMLALALKPHKGEFCIRVCYKWQWIPMLAGHTSGTVMIRNLKWHEYGSWQRQPEVLAASVRVLLIWSMRLRCFLSTAESQISSESKHASQTIILYVTESTDIHCCAHWWVKICKKWVSSSSAWMPTEICSGTEIRPGSSPPYWSQKPVESFVGACQVIIWTHDSDKA